MSLMRNKLTIVESKNTLLEQEKDDLTGTLNLLKTSVKPEPGNSMQKSVCISLCKSHLFSSC